MSRFTEAATIVYETEKCCNCGVLFAMEAEFRRQRLGDHASFYCPNGHPQSYMGKSWQQQIAQLEADKTALQAKVRREQEERATAERSAERAKKKAKQMEKRAANGVCPYCERSFDATRLQRHIHTKHPEKAHDPT